MILLPHVVSDDRGAKLPISASETRSWQAFIHIQAAPPGSVSQMNVLENDEALHGGVRMQMPQPGPLGAR